MVPPNRTGAGEDKDELKRKRDFSYVVASGGVVRGTVLVMAVVAVAFVHVRWVRSFECLVSERLTEMLAALDQRCVGPNNDGLN